jgi:large subunit ribosomal protein L17
MRHRKSGRKLNRTASHRKAVLSNLAGSLFDHKQVRTTVAKAKEVRKTVDRVITFAKSGSLADRRQVLKTIRDKQFVKTIFEDIAPTYKDRNGGYTRVVRIGNRSGDGADMAILELVGFEGVQLEKQKARVEAKAKKKEKEKEKAKEEEEKLESEAAAE